MAGLLFKYPLLKSTLFNNDFSGEIHSNGHAILQRVYISDKDSLHSYKAPPLTGFVGGSVVKNLPASAGDTSWIPRLRSPLE